MPENAIRILLVDDHPIVRDGLRGQLETQPDLVVIGDVASAEEALVTLRHATVDVVISDLRMPGQGGINLTREVTRQYPDTRVLVLTTFDSASEITQALAAGAAGYLLKDARREDIYAAVRAIAAGRTILAPAVSRRVIDVAASARSTPQLSAREIEVLQLVARGMTNAQIGVALYVGESTIKTHLQHIFRKLGAPDRAAAVATAYATGLL